MKKLTALWNCQFFYKENYSLYEWFNEAYGDEQENLLQQLSGPPSVQSYITGILYHGNR